MILITNVLVSAAMAVVGLSTPAVIASPAALWPSSCSAWGSLGTASAVCTRGAGQFRVIAKCPTTTVYGPWRTVTSGPPSGNYSTVSCPYNANNWVSYELLPD
jgi:hypothetical protein